MNADRMTEPFGLLATLQQADSFFPAGAIAFSWGMETLVVENRFRADRDLHALLRGQLEQRWAVFDRCALVAAYQAMPNTRAAAAIDQQVEAMILARELREGSRRTGASLLSVHERLGTPGASDYRVAMREGAACGHLPVVQGVVWRGTGMTAMQAQTASAHTFCVSLLGAVLRLGAIGHLQAQEALLSMRSTMAHLLEAPPPKFEECYSFTPMSEIAAMRHELQSARLFAN
jgi:urease accessory protein